MKTAPQITNAETIDFSYRGVYKAGAAAALIAAVLFRRNIDAEWMLFRMAGVIDAGPSAAPDTVAGWFTLLQQNQLLGLTFLNLFDLVNYALLELIFLALFVALRKARPSWSYIAAAPGLAGAAVYFASNQAFAMLSLSKQYAAAATGAQRAAILAAGQAVLAIHQTASYGSPGIYLSFLLVSVAGLLFSAAMLRGSIFSKSTAYMGLLANGFGLGYYLMLAIAPALVFVPISVSAVFLLVWYLQISRRLWALGSYRTTEALQIAAHTKSVGTLVTH